MTRINGVLQAEVPAAHGTSHQDTESDEFSVAGLGGLLAADQHVLDAEVLLVAAALVHKARHQNGGDDEISVAGLDGLLAADQHVLDAEVLAVAAALAHQASHIPGGAYPMRWTAAKLLLGAGAGADPTLVDLPTIATGNYTGNDGDGRQITVGFKCSFVIVQAITGTFRRATMIPSSSCWDGSGSDNGNCTANHYLHATDGFVVDRTAVPQLNVNAVTYYYWAISE